MIIETLVTTVDADGKPNVAPMGPVVPDDDPIRFRTFTLRPFKSSETYRNLKARPFGVLHVCDDPAQFIDALLGEPAGVGSLTFASNDDSQNRDRDREFAPRLADCCRFHRFRVTRFRDSTERTELTAEAVEYAEVRPFIAFNRARHAMIEAAILESRVGILDDEVIHSELVRLSAPVEKTGGQRERALFDRLVAAIERKLERLKRN
jgi:hypothetical protein